MLEVGAPVMVNFEDLALRGPDPVVVAVMALPPLFAAQWTATEAVVRPGGDYVRDNILPVVKMEGGGDLNLAYDFLNRLVKVTRAADGSTIAEYAYDGLGLSAGLRHRQAAGF